jgi:hypothetical protein
MPAIRSIVCTWDVGDIISRTISRSPVRTFSTVAASVSNFPYYHCPRTVQDLAFVRVEQRLGVLDLVRAVNFAAGLGPDALLVGLCARLGDTEPLKQARRLVGLVLAAGIVAQPHRALADGTLGELRPAAGRHGHEAVLALGGGDRV